MATRRARRGHRRAQLSSRAVRKPGLHRAKPCDSATIGVAHAGHMKPEKPRGDSWNRAAGRVPETRMKSQDRGDWCRLLNLRGCRTVSLPRRRSPVRTRCSAPIRPGSQALAWIRAFLFDESCKAKVVRSLVPRNAPDSERFPAWSRGSTLDAAKSVSPASVERARTARKTRYLQYAYLTLISLL